MTSKIMEDMISCLKEQGIVKKIIAYTEQSDVEKMISSDEMPVVGYSINQTGIKPNGMVVGTAEVYIVNMSNGDGAMIQAAKDTNVIVARNLLNNIDQFEGCSVEHLTGKDAENDNTLVATMASFKFSY